MTAPKEILLKEYQPYEFEINHVDLTFNIHEEKTIVSTVLDITKSPALADKQTALIFDAGNYKITQVVANEMVLLPGEYHFNKEYFKLNRTPDQFKLEITTELKPDENQSLEGLYKSGGIFCTQCEAEGFRKITPFPDRPDIMATYSCTIIADKTKYPVLLSNGNLVKSGALDNNRHFVRWEDPFQKPSYLFALVAGDLGCINDTFTTTSGRVIDLRIYSEHENINQCRFAMDALKQSMKWDEDRFRLEYDLDLYQIVAINDFNAGAMENKGLNIFNSKYVLADYRSATDEDFMNIQGVIGHEYFHNWTGNRVTLKNWFQLSLKEGLTVFRDQEFSSDLNSRGVKRVSCVKNLRTYQFPEDSGPMTHAVRPDSYIKMDNFYTMTVYEKGAELVRMIHLLLGEKNFQKGMDLYFESYDGMAVTVEDFLSVMEKASGIDLGQFMNWYVQSGTPLVKMKRRYDESRKELKITFSQSTSPDRNQKEKQPLHIPIGFGIINREGNDITPESQAMIELTQNEQTFTFKNIPPNSIPSVFRSFSAPIKLESDYSDEELAYLMAHDKDSFNRWDAAQTLFFKESVRATKAIQRNERPQVSETLVHAISSALERVDDDRAFLAKMITIPLETEIKEHFDQIDVDAIHDARQTIKKTVAKSIQSHLMDTIENCSDVDPKSISQNAMADRSLKNTCLSYIGSLNDDESGQLVKNHYEKALNMTDELAAFKILCQIDPVLKKEAVDQFYKKWKNDKLVLDKWFAVQAASTLSDTLDQVKNLCDHSDFSMTNPNKVRSLIYMFALHNPVTFHRIDGMGYDFIGEMVSQLDNINPMVAARLAGCFNHWKKYDENRQAKMKTQLEKIASIKSLSKNTYEIVNRALDG